MTTKKHITNYKPKLLSKGWLLLLGFMLFFGVANAWSIDNSNINGRVVNNSLPVEYALFGREYTVTDFVTYANSASEVSPVIRKYSSYFGIVYTMGRIGGSLYSSAKLAKAEEAAFAESAAKASSSEITTEETATATTVTSTEEKVTATSTEETAPTTTAEETTASEGITTSPATKENVPDETTTTEIKDGSVAKEGDDVIRLAKKEFDALGEEWIKKNPFTNKEMFNSKSGGYVVAHSKHNNAYIHEFSMAESFANDGRKVKLLSENAPLGVKTPDAEIVGEGIFDFKNISSNAKTTNLQKNIEDYVLGTRKQADNMALNLAENPNLTIDMVNKGVNNAIITAKANDLVVSLPDKVAVVYKDGKTKILTIKEIENGAKF